MIRKEDVFKIGYFGKPHGTKGEINLVTNTDITFEESDNPYIIVEPDGILVPFFLEEYRYKTDKVILIKLENIDSDTQAIKLTNLEVYYPIEYMDPSAGTIYDLTWDSLIGFSAKDEKYGDLGKITDVDESTINTLLKIEHGDTEILVPAADDIIIAIDHSVKEILLSLPEGLLDL